MVSRILLAASVSTFALAGAYAADLPIHKTPVAPAPAAPAFSWTGAYLGGFVGGNWAHTTLHDISNPAFIGDPALNSNGLTIGGLAGYNWQISNFVLGVEGEAGYDHRVTNANFINSNNPALGQPRNVAESGGVEGRLRSRLGYAFGNVLLFGAGGLTETDLKLTYTNLASGFNQSISQLRTGFNVGGGVEWAFAPNWSVRGEYIYDGFGARSYDFAALAVPAGVNPFGSRTAQLQESTARAVLAYKF